MKINKSQLINETSEACSGLTKTQVEAVINAYLEVVTNNVKKGNEVILSGVGILKLKERAPHLYRNLKTGENVLTPARKVVTLTIAKALKESVR